MLAAPSPDPPVLPGSIPSVTGLLGAVSQSISCNNPARNYGPPDGREGSEGREGGETGNENEKEGNGDFIFHALGTDAYLRRRNSRLCAVSLPRRRPPEVAHSPFSHTQRTPTSEREIAFAALSAWAEVAGRRYPGAPNNRAPRPPDNLRRETLRGEQ